MLPYWSMDEMEEVKEPVKPDEALERAEEVEEVMAARSAVESAVPTRLERVPPGRMMLYPRATPSVGVGEGEREMEGVREGGVEVGLGEAPGDLVELGVRDIVWVGVIEELEDFQLDMLEAPVPVLVTTSATLLTLEEAETLEVLEYDVRGVALSRGEEHGDPDGLPGCTVGVKLGKRVKESTLGEGVKEDPTPFPSLEDPENKCVGETAGEVVRVSRVEEEEGVGGADTTKVSVPLAR